MLFNAETGQPAAVMDGTELTLYRTACVSALASVYLSREDSEVLVMVGAGALAPHLIRAHIAARPSIKKVIIWNRNIAKAISLADQMLNDPEFSGISFNPSKHLDDDVAVADIVTCATNSETPLVSGAQLKPGTHLDLVGSFKESMKECDDEAIKKGKVYVDNEVAMVEAGELVGAFKRDVIRPDDVVGTLAEVVRGEKVGRRDSEEITVFKSVGSAVVDLLSAQLVYETFLKNQQLQKQ